MWFDITLIINIFRYDDDVREVTNVMENLVTILIDHIF